MRSTAPCTERSTCTGDTPDRTDGMSGAGITWRAIPRAIPRRRRLRPVILLLCVTSAKCPTGRFSPAFAGLDVVVAASLAARGPPASMRIRGHTYARRRGDRHPLIAPWPMRQRCPCSSRATRCGARTDHGYWTTKRLIKIRTRLGGYSRRTSLAASRMGCIADRTLACRIRSTSEDTVKGFSGHGHRVADLTQRDVLARYQPFSHTEPR